MLDDLCVAVFTDVHGNGFAIDAVLSDLGRWSPDIVVNLGDQLWGQADPMRAYDLLAELNAPSVRGNNDERLLMQDAQLDTTVRPLRSWLVEQLPCGVPAYLAALPTALRLADGEVLAAHGTPDTPWDGLLLDWDGNGYVPRPEQEVRARLASTDPAQVVVVGHMHREATRHLDGRLIVSVGPVSSQSDGDPRARWALLRRCRGRWSVEHRRVTYDWDAATRWEVRHGALTGRLALNHAAPPMLRLRDPTLTTVFSATENASQSC